MLNKSLIHKISPFQSNGRWYKFFIEVDDNGNYKITTKDKECTISGTTLKIPGIEIIDYVVRIHNTTPSVISYDKTFKLFADGSQGVNMPATTCTDYFTIWVFGVPSV